MARQHREPATRETRDLQLQQANNAEKHCICTKSVTYFKSIRTRVEKAVSDHAKAESVMRYELFKGQLIMVQMYCCKGLMKHTSESNGMGDQDWS